jgi:hypothetical protein
MKPSELALVQGLDHTKSTLRRWSVAPLPVVGRWAALSLAVTALLLAAVWAIASSAVPDTRPLLLPGLNEDAGAGDVGRVLARNGLVLALHAFACVAGFIAGSSLPLQAEHHSGWMRVLHEKAGPAAILFVAVATLFSLITQAFVLGSDAATLAAQLQISPGRLILTLLPHAAPELVALFLPLAAWLVASRAGRWDELLAATVVTCALAAPVLLLSASIEVYAWPDLMRAASPLG